MTTPPATLVSRLADRAAEDPGRLYARFDGTPLTVGELDRDSAAFAQGLVDRGLKRGEHVAVMMRNSVAALKVIFALARAGFVWVPVNAQQRGEGLSYLLQHPRPVLLVHDAEFGDVIDEAAARVERMPPRIVHDPAAGGLSAMFAGDRLYAGPAPEASDWFAIMYTSGTTGRPKGVIVTHSMLNYAARASALVADIRDGDVLFLWEPLFHIGGAQLLSLPLEYDIVLAMVPRFSASGFWDQVRAEGASHIHYLGGILQILLKQPETARDRDHGVRVAWGGGCPAATGKAFTERFGMPVRECYGMTEASSMTTVETDGTPGSVGRALPWHEVAIVDPEGKPVPEGERGEIVVFPRMPGALTPGYYDNPEATAKALRDGRFYTGDGGSFDADGRLYFHGRLTDSVRCRGENVSAFEVENVAAQYPDVEDCAMIGVAAEVGEQDIKLFVQPKEGQTVSPPLLVQWLAARLAPYQIPRYVVVVDGFERTASQRIMKHRLSTRLDDGWDRLAQREKSA
ncbi:class I adenylate-forming enzyme family protein [Acuticoccus kandeliae]|uniref:class I adenylate-forming enzyme family protein n=1 Tax=Acuticoccus kandeliae TaxID=2073160 RepID=UPI000D3E7E28|nr:AMP-binding protein [Acuticoccus kandeliae]